MNAVTLVSLATMLRTKSSSSPSSSPSSPASSSSFSPPQSSLIIPSHLLQSPSINLVSPIFTCTRSPSSSSSSRSISTPKRRDSGCEETMNDVLVVLPAIGDMPHPGSELKRRQKSMENME
ncbi:hypothetical protein BC829DRAFT_490377 [Chytridium lagenaria]|nr:hypothetical protein BC829DRAFT_490377 [Chytridium lagenaria]